MRKTILIKAHPQELLDEAINRCIEDGDYELIDVKIIDSENALIIVTHDEE